MMDPAIISQINRARDDRIALAVFANFATGEKQIVFADEAASHNLSGELKARFRSGKSGIVVEDGNEVFIEMHVPAPRLVIIGAVHISQALYPMAQACGFDVTIIDPRSAFATKDRFGDVKLLAEWPEEVLGDVAFDAYTAVAAVTHDPKIDDLPLQHALQADCFYVGALGSRKTHGKRRGRLEALGVAPDDLDRIQAPIGLNVGAANPAEIAVAVMAQIIEALRQDAS